MSQTSNTALALQWIVNIFHKYQIPFQITGGLAAKAYGSTRPLNDIDIDVPEEHITEMFSDVQDYRIFGPKRYRDERWDTMLLTLKYKNQLIDIGGAYATKICDVNSGRWIPVQCNFSTAIEHSLFDIRVPVVCPTDLILYKRLLKGKHQKQDIAAIEKYLCNPSPFIDK